MDEFVMLTLIENAEIYAPTPLGRNDVLLAGERIAKLGEVDWRALERAGLPVNVIPAGDCCLIPGLIDGHEHLLGGSGEAGFHTQTPAISLSELVNAGITTVVGCLGVDTTTKTMLGLLAQAKALCQEGLTAYIYSGGYSVPPVTLTGSVRNDMLLIEEVIGAGEIAIADHRATQAAVAELARLVSDAHVGGMLSGKAGVTHFHVGDHESRLSVLWALLNEYPIEPAWLYPTHVERQRALLESAAAFSRLGAFVDIDTVEEDLPEHLHCYLEYNGVPERLTVSSDAAISSPSTLLEQIRRCLLEKDYAPELVLSLVTANPAQVLKLSHKGLIAVGRDADLLLLRRASWELRTVIARGKVLLQDGQQLVSETYLAESNRRITLHGRKQRDTQEPHAKDHGKEASSEKPDEERC
jgi:beta-aspartyl-dipeptidase (metallo-type)